MTYSFGVFYDVFLNYFGEGKGATSWVNSILVGVTLCSGMNQLYISDCLLIFILMIVTCDGLTLQTMIMRVLNSGIFIVSQRIIIDVKIVRYDECDLQAMLISNAVILLGWALKAFYSLFNFHK